MNLAVNARDAMPQGGPLTITTGKIELGKPRAEAGLDVQPGPYTLLEVTDTGSGMTDDVRARIFEPFFTTKGIGAGTGLGLATVYGIVKQSGGHIDVSSQLGRGTTFKLYLPQCEEELRPAMPEEASPPTPVNGRKTILLVEDEDVVRSLVRTLLQRHGYTVLEAGNGDEALRLAAQHHGQIDLMMTDVVMPGISGGELARRLASGQPGMRVLYLSGYPDDALGQHGILEADIPFLHKPFTQDALTRKVCEVLEQRPASSRPANSRA
jgi:CheY-like chemotaxis protein